LDEERYYLSGLQYENEKNGCGAIQGNKNALKNETVESSTSFSNSTSEDHKFQAITTAERIAKQHGVSEKLIRDNGKS